MGKQEDPKTVTRREILKLAGTAAAFCASFGFLRAADGSGQIVDKNHKLEADAQLSIKKWKQAEIKWYKGGELLYSSPVPTTVLKYFRSDVNAAVELKLFRSGTLLRSLGTIESKF